MSFFLYGGRFFVKDDFEITPTDNETENDANEETGLELY